MIKTIQLLIEKTIAKFQSLITRKATPAYEMDDGPLSTDQIAKINAEAKKYIPTDEVPIETKQLF